MDIVSKITGNTLSATEFNQIPDELENLITSSGQTVSGAILTQDSIAVARYAANNFYTDIGAANAYVLTLASSFTSPVSATVGYFTGMTIKFRAGNANTTASTVNVNGAGVKDLKKADGTTALTAGDIATSEDSVFRYDGTVFRKVNAATAATESVAGVVILPKQITIANNGTDANNDIDFSAGNFQFSDGSGLATLSALTKQLDASWAAGTNQGGLFSGAKANSTWYHCFAIYNPTSGVADCGFDTSVTAANIPSGYTKYKRVGSIRTNGSGNILAFSQADKYFLWKTQTEDRALAAPPLSPTNLTLTTPLTLSTMAILNCYLEVGSASPNQILITNPGFTTAASTTNFNVRDSSSSASVSGITQIQVLTNTSSQVSIDAASTDGLLQVLTAGWIDYQL